ncbi:hypothetical protein TNCV_1678671 [Trichonephila clavipes]|nr:hypothetical protein TNCV_1678671 [Trichonephila clavipes]
MARDVDARPIGPVYMGENCRQYAGSNPLCTRLQFAGSKCRSKFRTLFRLGTLWSPMMHCARDSRWLLLSNPRVGQQRIIIIY